MKISDDVMNRIIEIVLERLNKPKAYLYFSESDLVLKNQIESHLEKQFELIEDIEQADIIYLVTASIRLLAELASGNGELENTPLILEHIAKGKQVVIIEEGIIHRKYEKTCPEKLYQKWCEYENEIASYGVSFITYKSLENKATVLGEKKSNNSMTISERLITERQLIQLKNHKIKEMILTQNAIITPLAQDYIRDEQIEVKRL